MYERSSDRKEALLLPDSERALLIDKLIESLSDATPQREASWIRKTEARYQVFCYGEIKAVDGPKAMAELRAGFSR